LGESFPNPLDALFDFSESLEVVAKSFIGLSAILETLEIGFQFGRKLGRQAVNYPSAAAGRLDHFPFPQVGKMLGHLCLRQFQNILKVADAERTIREQMNDAKPGCIAEALVNLDEFHEREPVQRRYICQ
jgi:hypothetical protein